MFHHWIIFISSIMIMVSNGCLLHDTLQMAARSTAVNDHIRLNNRTISKIYSNASELMREIDNESDAILVHLNQTSTNLSALALIVKNDAAAKSNAIEDQFKMYYVQLADEPLATDNGYRFYWKMFVDSFRKQMKTVMSTVWTPVHAINKYLRPNGGQGPQPNQNSENFFHAFLLPITLKAIDLPESIEQRIIEINEETSSSMNEQRQTNETINTNVNNNDSQVTAEGSIVQQVARKILMRAISAFKGRIWSQLQNQLRPSMLRNGHHHPNALNLFVTDKAVRIHLIGEQKLNGNVEFFEKQSTKSF